MPIQLTRETNIGDIEHAWLFNEYEQYDRGKWWYVIMLPVAVFLVLFGIFTGNFLFSLIIILFSIILFFQAYQKAPEVEFKITDLGVVLGSRFYEYSELDRFFVIYRPPDIKMLFLETKGTTRPLLRIPLEDINPVEVRHSLREFLEEEIEREDEPMSDKLARNWLFH